MKYIPVTADGSVTQSRKPTLAAGVNIVMLNMIMVTMVAAHAKAVQIFFVMVMTMT